MAKVKNTAKGPRGIRAKGGDLVMIEPGQTADGDFDASEVKDFKAMLAAEAGEAPAGEAEEAEEAESLSSLKKADLVAIAEAEGVAVETDDNRDDLIRKIEEAREAAGQ